MDSHSQSGSCCGREIEAQSRQERRILTTVLCINAAMFASEFIAGIVSESTALLADSLDMLADAVVYGIGLYALGRSWRLRAGAALTNGVLETLLGFGIVVEAIMKFAHGASPDAATMGAFGVLALFANVTCFVLLARYRKGDINLRATWICSRNDVLANAGVLLAAGLVVVTGSFWPDAIIGLIIALVVVKTALGVAIEATARLRTATSLQ
jgi:cation diffusion facilitator family transporter